MSENKRGRPPVAAGEKTVKVPVTIPPSDRQTLAEINAGNASQAVRDLIEMWRKVHSCEQETGMSLDEMLILTRSVVSERSMQVQDGA